MVQIIQWATRIICVCNVYVCLCVPAASNVMTVPIQAALKATKQHPQILPKPPATPGSAGEDCFVHMQSLECLV